VKRVAGLGAVLSVIVLGVAACGGGGTSVSSGVKRAKTHVQPAATAAPTPTIMTADSPLGKILVDANGHTLYEFDHDTSTASACTDACAAVWPALLVSGTPHAGTGVDAAKLGVLAVAAGSGVTYAGHLLHTFANHAAGDVTGQGFGGLWWVVAPDGQKITMPTSTVATTVPTSPQAGPAPTAAPQTAAPDTAPPATSPPAPQPTTPPKTAPPATSPPSGGGVAF